MTTIVEKPDMLAQDQRSQIKQELRKRINDALQSAKNLSPNDCLNEIRNRLLAIQIYAETVNKTFIVVEESITCDQFNLGGHSENVAILFRGPSEDASVAVCVTQKGSLLHRNGSLWQIHRNEGDVNPVAVF